MLFLNFTYFIHIFAPKKYHTNKLKFIIYNNNMKITQPKELIEKYNSIFVEKSDRVISFSNGSVEIYVTMLYTMLYGHNPMCIYYLKEDMTTKEIKFMDWSLQTLTLADKMTTINKNYSFIDTVDKLGCIARPSKRNALYISDLGIIRMESFGGTIGDSSISKIGYVSIFADEREHVEMLAAFLMENMVEVNLESPETVQYKWVKNGFSNSLTTQTLEFKKTNVVIQDNYNDDLPYEKIMELINSDNKELILFNGKPGTGKTSLIKHLMGVTDKTFLYIDSNLLRNVPSSTFIEFLLGNRNSIIVLEDCEKILSKREEGNPFMGTLLNITDGIIGETINSKFICSFNCSENKVDEALLRKGRLTLKYTFNELALEKTRKLIPEATKPMTLAEIYHNKCNNIINKQIQHKIGF